jgi:threonine dehydratase
VNDLYLSTVTRSALEEAHFRAQPFIHRTPVMTSAYFNQLSGASLFFKCENFQKTGSFKIRGILNTVLEDDEKQHGLATFSSGNHAQALAYGAKLLQLPAYVAMPEDANKVKVSAVREYQAKITYFGKEEGQREAVMDEVLRQTGARFIHPFDAESTIFGQSGVAKELIEDAGEELDFILVPVGGGGIMAGTALAAAHFSPGTAVFAAEPELAADACASFRAGKRVQRDFSGTKADGLKTNLGRRNFEIMLGLVKDVLLVSEPEISDAMLAVWHRMKLIIEPSAAVGLAAVLRNKDLFHGKKVGVLLTGGNVDLSAYPFS